MNVQSAAAIPTLVAVVDTVYGIGGIITGFDRKSSGYGLYIQLSTGAQNSGIDVFTGSYNKSGAPYNLAIGDSVVVYGKVQIFQGEAEIEGYDASQGTDDMLVRVVSSGNTLPPFFVGTTTMLKETPTNTTAEAYEGMLARVNQTGASTLKVARTVGLGTNAFLVVDSAAPSDSVFIDGNTLATFPAPALGTAITFVRGIVNQRTRGYRIQLRDGGDIEVATPPNVTDAYPIADNTIRVVFDRPVTAVTATDINNYSLGSFGSVDAAVMDGTNAALLTITNGLAHGVDETVTVNSIAGLLNGFAMFSGQSKLFINGVLSCAEVQAANPDSLVRVAGCIDMSRFAGSNGQLVQGQGGKRCSVIGVMAGKYTPSNYLADEAGDQRSGLQVFAPPLPMQTGHKYLVVGAVQEFFGETEFNFIVDARDLGLATAPAPAQPLLSVFDHVGCDPTGLLEDAEDYEGGLLRVNYGKVVLAQGLVTPPTNGFHIANIAGSDTIFVSNFNSVLSPFAAPPLGTLVQVTGILGYNNSFRIMPRSWADVVTMPVPTFTLTVAVDGPGFVTGSPAESTYALESLVQLTAVPLAGNQFLGWSGDVSTMTNPLALLMGRSLSVIAHFGPLPRFAVSATAAAGGTASVTPNAETFAFGDTALVQALPDSGYIFAGWVGDTATFTNPLMLVISRDRTMVAQFVPSSHVVSVCARAEEGASLTLGSPGGGLIIGIQFASYGRATGICGQYLLSSCHAPLSAAVVESLAVGHETCVIPVSNTVFGDPCGGGTKWLIVQYQIASDTAPAQPESVLCGSVVEGSTLNLNAPQGMIIEAVEFASYGNPLGDPNDCATLSQGPCHAMSSKSVVESLCLGMTSLTVSAWNGQFGDPCPSTTKRLAVRLRCGIGRPDLVAAAPAGWATAVVPRNDSSIVNATVAPIELLSDAASTHVSVAVAATNLNALLGWQYSLTLDGKPLGFYALDFDPSILAPTYTSKRLGPFAVSGGWHTLTGLADASNLLAESNESNNLAQTQWLWRPSAMTRNVVREQPSAPLAGDGARANCDAFQISRDPRFAWVVAIAPQVLQDDLDLTLCDDYDGPFTGLAHVLSASNTRGSGIDYIVGSSSGSPSFGYPVVTRYAAAAAAPYRIEYTDARGQSSDVGSGIWANRPFPANRAVQVYELYFETLSPHHLALVRHGQGHLAFEVMEDGASGLFARGSGGSKGASIAVGDSLDSLVYLPARIGWHPVVVYREGPGDSLTYTFLSQDHAVLDASSTERPLALALSRMSPNPLDGTSGLTLALPQTARVELEVFDVSGRRVRVLRSGELPAGTHTVRWNGADGRGTRVAPGLYLVVARVGEWRQTRRVVVR